MTVRACHKRIRTPYPPPNSTSSSPQRSRLQLAAAAVLPEVPMPEAGLAATYLGHVGSTKDALVIIEACLSGYLNHISRRPRSSEEWTLPQSGNIFVYESRSSGITTWRDGIPWSEPIRVGNFELRRQLASPASRSSSSNNNRTNGVALLSLCPRSLHFVRTHANEHLFQGHTVPAGFAKERSVSPYAA